jgi:hypothetical protein
VLPLSLLQRCGCRPFGSMRCDLRGRLALAVMNGRLMLMADMGPGNRRRERKHDQDDRRSQNSHDLLLWHDGSIVAQVSPRYRRGTGNSRSSGRPDPCHPLSRHSGARLLARARTPIGPRLCGEWILLCAIAHLSSCFARPGRGGSRVTSGAIRVAITQTHALTMS